MSDNKANHRLIQGLFLAGILVSCALLLGFENLPFLDYPNHLARYYLLTRDFNTPLFHQYYDTNFRIIPNVGVDLLMAGIGRVVDPALGLRLLLCGTVCLWSFSFAKLSLKRNEGQWHPALILLPLTYFSFSLILGFLNFVFAASLIPLGIYGYEKLARRSAKLQLVFLLALVLFFCHMMAAVLFLAIIATKVLSEERDRTRLIGIGTVILTLGFIAALYKLSSVSNEHSAIVWTPVLTKIKYFFSFMVVGPWWMATTFLAFVGFAAVLLKTYKGISRSDRYVLLMLLGFFIICPEGFKLSGNFDARMPAIVIGFLLGFAVLPKPISAPKRRWSVYVLGFALIVGVSFASLFSVIRRSDGEARKMRSILREIPENDAMFIADVSAWEGAHRDNWYPAYRMLPFFTAIDRPLFVSGIFTFPSQQPVVLKSSLKELGFVSSMPPKGTPVADQVDQIGKDLQYRLSLLRGEGITHAWVFFVNYQSTGFPSEDPHFLVDSVKSKYMDSTYRLVYLEWKATPHR